MKKCPFCAEEIQDAAIKCRYCGSMLTEATPTPVQVSPPPPKSFFLVLIGGVGAVVLGAMVLGPLLFSPGIILGLFLCCLFVIWFGFAFSMEGSASTRWGGALLMAFMISAVGVSIGMLVHKNSLSALLPAPTATVDPPLNAAQKTAPAPAQSTVGVATVATPQGLPPSAGKDPSQIDVDINSKKHIILRTPAPRDWNNVTVEINETWRFTLTGVPRMSSVCINAAAFTMRGKGPTVYFSPSNMDAKTVSVRAADGRVMPLHSVSIGMIKPLTSQQAAGCLNALKAKDAK